MQPIEFWVSVGSTYAYLTISRLPRIEAETGLKFSWRVFSARALMLETGATPFARPPLKARYMWRDIDRRAASYGLAPQLPAPYPITEYELANRVAVVACQEGLCRDYLRETYRRWFELGEPAGSRKNLDASLSSLGLDPDAVIDRANRPETEAAWLTATEEARARGIFGAPSFVVGDELFWGDDRLEDAISWARKGRVRPPERIVAAG